MIAIELWWTIIEFCVPTILTEETIEERWAVFRNQREKELMKRRKVEKQKEIELNKNKHKTIRRSSLIASSSSTSPTSPEPRIPTEVFKLLFPHHERIMIDTERMISSFLHCSKAINTFICQHPLYISLKCLKCPAILFKDSTVYHTQKERNNMLRQFTESLALLSTTSIICISQSSYKSMLGFWLRVSKICFATHYDQDIMDYEAIMYILHKQILRLKYLTSNKIINFADSQLPEFLNQIEYIYHDIQNASINLKRDNIESLSEICEAQFQLALNLHKYQNDSVNESPIDINITDHTSTDMILLISKYIRRFKNSQTYQELIKKNKNLYYLLEPQHSVQKQTPDINTDIILHNQHEIFFENKSALLNLIEQKGFDIYTRLTHEKFMKDKDIIIHLIKYVINTNTTSKSNNTDDEENKQLISIKAILDHIPEKSIYDVDIKFHLYFIEDACNILDITEDMTSNPLFIIRLFRSLPQTHPTSTKICNSFCLFQNNSSVNEILCNLVNAYPNMKNYANEDLRKDVYFNIRCALSCGRNFRNKDILQLSEKHTKYSHLLKKLHIYQNVAYDILDLNQDNCQEYLFILIELYNNSKKYVWEPIIHANYIIYSLCQTIFYIMNKLTPYEKEKSLQTCIEFLQKSDIDIFHQHTKHSHCSVTEKLNIIMLIIHLSGHFQESEWTYTSEKILSNTFNEFYKKGKKIYPILRNIFLQYPTKHYLNNIKGSFSFFNSDGDRILNTDGYLDTFPFINDNDYIRKRMRYIMFQDIVDNFINKSTKYPHTFCQYLIQEKLPPLHALTKDFIPYLLKSYGRNFMHYIEHTAHFKLVYYHSCYKYIYANRNSIWNRVKLMILDNVQLSPTALSPDMNKVCDYLMESDNLDMMATAITLDSNYLLSLTNEKIVDILTQYYLPNGVPKGIQERLSRGFNIDILVKIAVAQQFPYEVLSLIPDESLWDALAQL